MFKSKYRFLPKRYGERFGSIMINNNAKKILGYKAKIDIKEYITQIVKKK